MYFISVFPIEDTIRYIYHVQNSTYLHCKLDRFLLQFCLSISARSQAYRATYEASKTAHVAAEMRRDLNSPYSGPVKPDKPSPNNSG